MARQARYDLAQTCPPKKLAVEQPNELTLGRQPPYPRIGAVIFHKSVEPIPRNMLQQPVKYAILMQHGMILFPVQNVAKRLEHRRFKAMRLVHKKRSRGTRPGMTSGEVGRSITELPLLVVSIAA